MPTANENEQTLAARYARLIASGEYTVVATQCQKALRLTPDNIGLRILLGQALHGLGDLENAGRHLQAALNQAPGNTEAALSLAAVLLQAGQRESALAVYRSALQHSPGNPSVLTGMGRTLLQLGQPRDAMRVTQQVLDSQPAHLTAAILAADIEEKQGLLNQAFARLKPLVDSNSRDPELVIAYASVCRSLKRPADAIAPLRQAIEAAVTPNTGLHFALGELLDSTGDYDQAMAQYHQGNRMHRGNFDRSLPVRDVDTMIDLYTREYVQQMPRSNLLSDLPVFIIGMHRSGSSLVEQILASHPLVHGAGELPDIMQQLLSLQNIADSECRYLHCLPLLDTRQLDQLARTHLDRLRNLGGPAQRVTDKMPGNFLYLGYIQQAYPGARIIHCRRNPLDTCLSTYFQNIGGGSTYMNNLGDIGHVYRCYHRMMTHWSATLDLPVLEIQYEQLVTDPEPHIRKLVEFCDLPWDDNCLAFHTSRRYVNTVSYDQVRQPMYTRSVARWKNYDKHLGELRNALGDLA